jgi:hypothetical protein
MSERFKMCLGWICYRVLLIIPASWWSTLRLDGEFLAMAGYYAYAPTPQE